LKPDRCRDEELQSGTFLPYAGYVPLNSRGDAAKYAGPESPPLSEDNLPKISQTV
jgi:hypothetical protein